MPCNKLTYVSSNCGKKIYELLFSIKISAFGNLKKNLMDAWEHDCDEDNLRSFLYSVLPSDLNYLVPLIHQGAEIMLDFLEDWEIPNCFQGKTKWYWYEQCSMFSFLTNYFNELLQIYRLRILLHASMAQECLLQTEKQFSIMLL